MTNAIERHGGVVTSYMGDGVMALFDTDPASACRLPEPARRARRAGDPRPRRCSPSGLEELYGRSFDMNVGLHFGTAIVGTLLGDPATITAIGDTVNMANRIEQANKEFGTRLLVSDAARADAGDAVVIGRSFHSRCPARPASTNCSRCSV